MYEAGDPFLDILCPETLPDGATGEASAQVDVSVASQSTIDLNGVM